MTENPCDTCREECLGGIIYGNCRHFRSWCRDNLLADGRFHAHLHAQEAAICHPGKQ